MAAKKPRFSDPKDEFIRSETNITIKQLSKLYRGKKGCSEGQLSRRCSTEKWVDQRKEFQAELREKTAEKISEKLSEKLADKHVVKLEELNKECYDRTRHLLKVNEQKLKDGIGFDAEGKPVIKLSSKEIRIIQSNIRDLHHELRLYANFDPKKPIEEKGDNSDDDNVLNELFGDIFGLFQEAPKDG